MNKNPTKDYSYGYSYFYRPDRPRFSRGNERSIITAVYNRIALDVSSVAIRHVRLDENGRYIEDMDSGLNDCLTLEANVDQTPRAFIQDVVISMLDEGCVAIVPVEPEPDPEPEEPDIPSYPDFVQPTGAHDAYQTGDIVNYNGVLYKSKINNNVWAPDVYPAGWEVYEG